MRKVPTCLFFLSAYLMTNRTIESKAPRTFKEWVIAFLENDEEEAQQYAQLLREREEEAELLGSHHHHAENDDTGYYDELELEELQ